MYHIFSDVLFTSSSSSSYQQKILSMLAEHIMKSIHEDHVPPTQPTGPSATNVPAPLPDVVTSSLTPHTNHAAAEAKPPKSYHRKHSLRVLRKFSKYHMSLLERESRYNHNIIAKYA